MDHPYGISAFAFPNRWDLESGSDIRNGGVGEWLKPAVLKNETGCLLSC
jgi:hypothetical protein